VPCKVKPLSFYTTITHEKDITTKDIAKYILEIEVTEIENVKIKSKSRI